VRVARYRTSFPLWPGPNFTNGWSKILPCTNVHVKRQSESVSYTLSCGITLKESSAIIAIWDRHHLHAAVRSVGHVVVIMSSTECRLTLSVHLKRLQHSSFSEIIETDRMPVRLTGVMDNLSTAVPRANLSSSYVTLHLNCDTRTNLHHHKGYKKHVFFEYSEGVRT
jgi:hypothetical protein